VIVLRRRLFWRVYLTLLASLVAVAVLMGTLWMVLGENRREGRAAFRIHLGEQIIPGTDSPPGAINRAVDRLGAELGADISVYGPEGALVASLGLPIPLSASERSEIAARSRIIRIDLADGRVVLARLRPPPNIRWRILFLVLIVTGGVGLAAFPVTSRLTRRLEDLRSGVRRWGAGELSLRVDDGGDDEVAIVARTFNAAAGRVEQLVRSQKALLANASHELRSPLARLRIAIELWLVDRGPATQAEIVRNLAEIDELIEEILLASRLDYAGPLIERAETIDLLGLAAEEGSRLGAGVAVVGDAPVEIPGDRKLLRRLVRNLLENAAKHGRPPIEIAAAGYADKARLTVSDHGPGIPEAERERVFEPFHRPAGYGESSGGWGLGLSLARQIAKLHGGAVFCEPGIDGGNRFVVELPKTSRSRNGGADGGSPA
jgi:signal transduction histidine kinase